MGSRVTPISSFFSLISGVLLEVVLLLLRSSLRGLCCCRTDSLTDKDYGRNIHPSGPRVMTSNEGLSVPTPVILDCFGEKMGLVG